jgi:hypothetical protein
MKLLLTAILSVFTASLLHAQETERAKPDLYVSAGLSISNSYDTTFSYSSYPSLEVGLMKNNFSMGLVLGRSNLSGFRNDDISNYWYELKAALAFPVGKFNGYGLLGVGNYISTERIFVEYGAGFSYSFKQWGVFSQVSNWDGVWYVTPGVSYTF